MTEFVLARERLNAGPDLRREATEESNEGNTDDGTADDGTTDEEGGLDGDVGDHRVWRSATVGAQGGRGKTQHSVLHFG